MKTVTPFHHLAFNSYLMDRAAKIYFENPTFQEAFNKLLIHSCSACPSKTTFSNLQALKDHLRKEHELFFCDLCVDNLKVCLFFLLFFCTFYHSLHMFMLFSMFRFLLGNGKLTRVLNLLCIVGKETQTTLPIVGTRFVISVTSVMLMAMSSFAICVETITFVIFVMLTASINIIGNQSLPL